MLSAKMEIDGEFTLYMWRCRVCKSLWNLTSSETCCFIVLVLERRSAMLSD